MQRLRLTEFDCPAAAVPPPFARGPVSLTFPNGRLVAVQVSASSYKDTVDTISAKYGTPVYSRWQKDGWHGMPEPSFAINTAFDWRLKGGRIRVGRMTGTPFVAFIRDERDDAIANSF